MRHTFTTFALGGALALALSACSTDMDNRWNNSTSGASTSGSTAVGTDNRSTAPTYDNTVTNGNRGEAGSVTTNDGTTVPSGTHGH